MCTHMWWLHREALQGAQEDDYGDGRSTKQNERHTEPESDTGNTGCEYTTIGLLTAPRLWYLSQSMSIA